VIDLNGINLEAVCDKGGRDTLQLAVAARRGGGACLRPRSRILRAP
jgi:hypothetical protein